MDRPIDGRVETFAGAVPRGKLFVSGVVQVPAHQVIGGKEWRSQGGKCATKRRRRGLRRRFSMRRTKARCGCFLLERCWLLKRGRFLSVGMEHVVEAKSVGEERKLAGICNASLIQRGHHRPHFAG